LTLETFIPACATAAAKHLKHGLAPNLKAVAFLLRTTQQNGPPVQIELAYNGVGIRGKKPPVYVEASASATSAAPPRPLTAKISSSTSKAIEGQGTTIPHRRPRTNPPPPRIQRLLAPWQPEKLRPLCRGTIIVPARVREPLFIWSAGAPLRIYGRTPASKPRKMQLEHPHAFLYILLYRNDRHNQTDTHPRSPKSSSWGEMSTSGASTAPSLRFTPCSSFRRTHCLRTEISTTLAWPAQRQHQSPRIAGLWHRQPGPRPRDRRDHFQTTKTSGNLPTVSEERKRRRSTRLCGPRIVLFRNSHPSLSTPSPRALEACSIS